MNEIAWAAIGILAASMFGNLYWLGSRIDGLADRIDTRFDAVNARLDAMSARLDSHLESHAQ